MTVLERIRAFLKEHQYTSAEAARVRGESLQSGARALILKVDGGFALFVLPGDRRMSSKQIKRAAWVKYLRFATPEEKELRRI